METRKFIWNFFLVLLFGSAAVVSIYGDTDIWDWITFGFCTLVASQSVRKLEETFKK